MLPFSMLSVFASTPLNIWNCVKCDICLRGKTQTRLHSVFRSMSAFWVLWYSRILAQNNILFCIFNFNIIIWLKNAILQHTILVLFFKS